MKELKKNVLILPVDINVKPYQLFYFLFSSNKYSNFIFLDSSLIPNKYSKYSYIALNPDFVIKGFKDFNEIEIYKNFNKSIEDYLLLNNCYILNNSNIAFNNSSKYKPIKKIIRSNLHPLKFLKLIFNMFLNNNENGNFNKTYKFNFNKDSFSFLKDMNPDFIGGFVGYFSYDLKNYIEKLPQTAVDDVGVPLYYFMYFSDILAYNHSLDRWLNISISDNTFNIFDKSNNDFGNFIIRENQFNLDGTALDCNIEKQIVNRYKTKKIKNIELKSNFSKKDYINAVLKAKEYIHNGDIYQVNLTQRFFCETEIKPYDLYYILRKKNPAPFSAYISFPEFTICSSSPERFIFIKNNNIHTRPIKGTRPRGSDSLQDKKFINELKNSIKDRAELNMIVDLERNDLGKFCQYGTVKVVEHAVIEKYAKVFHSVSTIEGKILEGYDIVDIIKSVFPGGSITGAPKIRAMEIIDELEPNTRGVYTGSIGYIGIDGTVDLNIAIRTFVIKDKKFYYNVGGGIVEDSIPYDEYQETLDKGLALKETLNYFLYENVSL